MRESFAEGEPPSQWIRTEERYTYVNNETDWLIKLPVRSEMRDSEGVPWAVQIRYYDGSSFTGLPEGQATHGLPMRVQQLRLLESRLPADYLVGQDLTALGYELIGTGDMRGWYVTTLAVRRDSQGNAVEQRDPAGTSFTIDYDGDDLYPIRSIDARGKQTLLSFNPRSGEPWSIEFPDGRRVRHEYDPLGRLVATYETDDAGTEQLTKCWVVDLLSLPTSITSVAPESGGRTRAEFSLGTDFAALNGVSVARAFYDGFGKQILQVATAPDASDGARRFGASAHILLNPKGLVSTRFAPSFVTALSYTPPPTITDATVRQRYDVLGNVTETLGPGPAHFRVVRDTFTIHHYEGPAAGAFAEAAPPGPPMRVEYFDARGRLVRIEEAKGDGTTIVTSYELNPEGGIAVIRDNAGAEVARYTFAGPGEPIRISHRDVGTRTYYRYASGKVAERVDSDGSTLFYQYDAQGRLTRIEHLPAGGGTRQTIRELAYDADPILPSTGRFLEGRIALLREAGHELRYSYNRAGKAVREEITTSGVTLVTQRIYNLQGRLLAIVYPDGHRLDYTLDHSGSVWEVVGVATNFTYGPDGVVEGYRLANGVQVTMPRQPVSMRLATVTAVRDETTLRRIDYTYDPVGTIRAVRDEMPGNIEYHSFTYDGLFRLTGYVVRANDAAGILLRAGSYGYDTDGNLQQFEDTQPLAMSYGDLAHPGRLTGINEGTNFHAVSYNDRGHMTAFGNLAAIEYDPQIAWSRPRCLMAHWSGSPMTHRAVASLRR